MSRNVTVNVIVLEEIREKLHKLETAWMPHKIKMIQKNMKKWNEWRALLFEDLKMVMGAADFLTLIVVGWDETIKFEGTARFEEVWVTDGSVVDFVQKFFQIVNVTILRIRVIPIMAAGDENNQWSELNGCFSSSNCWKLSFSCTKCKSVYTELEIKSNKKI